MAHGDVKRMVHGAWCTDEGIFLLDLACICLRDLMRLSGGGLLPSRKFFDRAFASVMPGPTPKRVRIQQSQKGKHVHMQSDL